MRVDAVICPLEMFFPRPFRMFQGIPDQTFITIVTVAAIVTAITSYSTTIRRKELNNVVTTIIGRRSSTNIRSVTSETIVMRGKNNCVGK